MKRTEDLHETPCKNKSQRDLLRRSHPQCQERPDGKCQQTQVGNHVDNRNKGEGQGLITTIATDSWVPIHLNRTTNEYSSEDCLYHPQNSKGYDGIRSQAETACEENALEVQRDAYFDAAQDYSVEELADENRLGEAHNLIWTQSCNAITGSSEDDH